MSGKDRKKQLARQRYERQLERRAAQARKARRVRVIGSAVAVVVVAAAIGGISLLAGADDSSDGAANSPAATPSTPANQPQDGKPKQEISISGVSVKGGSGGSASCDYKDSSGDKGIPEKAGKPEGTAAYKGKVEATIKTSLGDLKAELDADKAPCTVNSFAYLAKSKYFEKSKCHRVTTTGGQPGALAVLQCGDPTATGAGGPGYRYANENTEGAKYSRGVLAMAHSQEPDSNGSQFFIVYADSELPPEYTIFGKVTAGMELVDKVAQAGVAAQ